MGDTCVKNLGMGETWYTTVMGDREQLEQNYLPDSIQRGTVADRFCEWVQKAKDRPSLASLPWVREHRGQQGVNMCAYKSR